MNHFMNQSIMTGGNNICVEQTLYELMYSNKELLQRISSATIHDFVELCKSQVKDERFLILLQSFCSVNNEPVPSN